MSSGLKKMRRRTVIAIAGILLMGSVRPVSAQIGIGADVVRAADAFGGTTGIGARVRLGVPLFPVSAAINGDWFFPDCRGTECSLRGVTLDVNYSFPLPLLHPWVGVGWSIRRIEIAGMTGTERGLNVGIGAELELTKFRPFVDLRYEMADAPERQYVARIGLMFN